MPPGTTFAAQMPPKQAKEQQPAFSLQGTPTVAQVADGVEGRVALDAAAGDGRGEERGEEELLHGRSPLAWRR
jgi:hypothetical protein